MGPESRDIIRDSVVFLPGLHSRGRPSGRRDWRVGSGRPALHDAAGKNAHARVRKVNEPDATDLRTWSAHEHISVQRVSAEEGQAMTRLRRASVIAALSLHASAATASADCAWVFWFNPAVS